MHELQVLGLPMCDGDIDFFLPPVFTFNCSLFSCNATVAYEAKCFFSLTNSSFNILLFVFYDDNKISTLLRGFGVFMRTTVDRALNLMEP